MEPIIEKTSSPTSCDLKYADTENISPILPDTYSPPPSKRRNSGKDFCCNDSDNVFLEPHRLTRSSRRKQTRKSTESTASTIGEASMVDSQLFSDEFEGMSTSFAEPPSSTLRRRSVKLLKRISSTTSFDLRSLSRKRKRKDAEEDNISVQSFSVGGLEPKATSQDKKSKRNGGSSMKKMSSLVNMLSPANNRVGRALERSFSFKQPNSPASATIQSGTRQITPYKKPKPASSDRRASKFWCETVDQRTKSTLVTQEIKRQEAIFELVQGEEDLIKDLKMLQELYRNSMRLFNLMTDAELDKIFSIVQRLIPFHEKLLDELTSLRKADGTTDSISSILLEWVPNLREYESYCANQVFAKGLLDYKKNDPRVEDFLNRCQQSSFSRKLDLWNFLDLPRSRLVKYPLLFKQIQKLTVDGHPDKELLDTVIEQVEDIIKEVDTKMGESECKQVIENLEFSYESQKSDLINQSTSLVCAGQLKNERGTKVHVFLFDQVLVVTRQATRNNLLKYQVIKEPIPLSQLQLVDLSELESRRGSFRKKVLRQTTTEKCAFRIGDGLNPTSHSHTLHTKDEHDKRQWLSSIRKAMSCEEDIGSSCDDQERMSLSIEDPIPELIATESLSSSCSSPENNLNTSVPQPKLNTNETLV